MSDQTVVTVRLPQKLIQALDQLTVSDGLNKALSRADVIRDLLAEGVRAGQRRASR